MSLGLVVGLGGGGLRGAPILCPNFDTGVTIYLLSLNRFEGGFCQSTNLSPPLLPPRTPFSKYSCYLKALPLANPFTVCVQKVNSERMECFATSLDPKSSCLRAIGRECTLQISESSTVCLY